MPFDFFPAGVPAKIKLAVSCFPIFMLFACNRALPENKVPDIPNPSKPASVAETRPRVSVSLLGTDSAMGMPALIDTAIARLLRLDTVALVKLMVNDSDFRHHIFPTSPAFDASSENAFQFVLAMHKANGAKALRRLLAEVGRPDFSPGEFSRDYDSAAIPGGMIYRLSPGKGLRPLGSALRIGETCRIATFAKPGTESGD